MPMTPPSLHAGSLPVQPFFTSPEQRAALARERFFDGGPRPTGLVSEAVLQSWSRCRAAGRDPRGGLAFDPVTRSGLHAALERSRALLLAAEGEIARLESAIADTATRVLLTDAQGVVVHATGGNNDSEQPVLRRAARRGVSLVETVAGTNALAVVLKTGEAATVSGVEHFHECVATLRCAAAPILDAQGRIAGVLDLTVEARPFAYDAAALVGVYATVIGNRLLEAAAGEHLMLAFQVCPSMIGSPLQALAGVDSAGRVAWCNRAARQLLGLGEQRLPPAETMLGLTPQALLARCRDADARPLRLPNGLAVWLQVRAPGAPGHGVAGSGEAPTRVSPPAADADAGVAAGEVQADAARPAQAQPGASLSGMTRELIDRTIDDCGGNLARAARLLGVSRGLLYRRRSGVPAQPRSGPRA